MSVQPPRKGWNVIGAMFLGCGGLLFLGLGGMCSVLIFADGMFNASMWPMLLLSLGLLAGGAALIHQAIKLFRQ